MKGYKYLFGPVPSRRLGLSLGIDLFDEKRCTFNCVYCECGPSTHLAAERAEFAPFEDVAAELRRFLPREGLDYVTFSGSGEPTLHSRLGDLIRVVRDLTDVRVAIITNSSLITRADVRRDLALADVVMPSLDAATQDVMRRINRSPKQFLAAEIIDGLVKFRAEFSGRMDLEILFCKGLNDAPEEITALKAAVERIRPDRVQLNTVDRPPAVASARPLTRAELEDIRRAFVMDNVEIIAAYEKTDAPMPADDMGERIMSLVMRRGVYEDDLLNTFCKHIAEAKEILAQLCVEGKIERIIFEGRPQYRKSAERTKVQ